MPTTPESPDGAAAAARREAADWWDVARAVSAFDRFDPSPTESAVVRFHDPAADLARRASRWNHTLEDHSLASLARFAGGLAAAEATAWTEEARDVALAAFDDRRSLVGDRIMHWAVPWLTAVSDSDSGASTTLTRLLEVGDVLRPAPSRARGEGVHPPGEDSYGPIDVAVDDEFLMSVWSGAVWLRGMAGWSVPGPEPSAAGYAVWSRRWSELASRHEGAAALWLDLADRAGRTAHLLGRRENA